jgi:hypothetical protein
MASGEADITEEIHPVDSKWTSVYPPVPPELLAEQQRSYHEANG